MFAGTMLHVCNVDEGETDHGCNVIVTLASQDHELEFIAIYDMN